MSTSLITRRAASAVAAIAMFTAPFAAFADEATTTDSGIPAVEQPADTTASSTDQNVGSEGTTIDQTNTSENDNSGFTTQSVDVLAVTDLFVNATGGNDTTGDGSEAAPYATIAKAVSVATANNVIHVSGTQIVTSAINVSIPLTIEAEGTSEIDTTGSNNVFAITGNGPVVIQGFNFVKGDNADQNIILISGNNVSIENNQFTGQYVLGGGGTTRAMVVSPGVTGLDIGGNTISHLRQPAYLDIGDTGSVHNNTVGDSKGFVVASGANLTIENNSFGTNIGDIALICGSGGGPNDNYVCPDANNYTDIVALSNANNGAVVEQQTPVKANAVLSVAYVDASAVAGGNGTKATPYQNVASAVARVVAGGTLHLVSDVTTPSTVTLNRAIIIDGGSHTLTAGFSGASVIDVMANDVTIRNLVEDGGTTAAVPTTANRGINVYVATGVTLDGVTASNNSKNGIVVNGSEVTANNITTSNNGWEGIDVDLGSGVTSPATLTVTGVSHHTEALAAIRIDDTTKAVSVNDTANQYSFTDTGVVRDYVLVPFQTGNGGGGGHTSASSNNSSSDNGSTGDTGTTGDTGDNGQVLGASTFNFTGSTDATVGSTGEEVNALQQVLINLGFLKIGATTGFFGPLTQAALASFQAAHNIYPAEGYFGPITRAFMDAMPMATQMTTAEIQAKIDDLEKQVEALQKELDDAS